MRHLPDNLLRYVVTATILARTLIVPAVGADEASIGDSTGRSNRIQRLVLNPAKVTRVFVGEDRLTTLRFPSPIASLESARVVAELHPDALFQVYFQPGESFFSIRALAPGAATSLNVVWNHQTHVLELIESPTPWLSVVFEVSRPIQSASRRMPLVPSQLLGRLDTAKAYALLEQQHPAAVAGIEVVRPNTVRDYGDYTIRMEEVFRFNAEDVLVFRIVLRNTTEAPIHFVPASLMVRVGTRIYPQSITDATGILPSQTDVPVYFAVAGAADGSRADLSVKNDFFVLLNRLPSEPVIASQPTNSSPPAVVPVPSIAPPIARAPTKSPPPATGNPYGVQLPTVTAPRHPVSPSRRRESWPPRLQP
ncbi:MAG: hypothetical protein AB7O66_22620 [Limisphaerales bacterium]